MRLFAEPLPAKLVWDEGELVALVVAVGVLRAPRSQAEAGLDILSILPSAETALERGEAPQISPDGRSVAFVAADPDRAAAIAFTPPYVELDATYLVRGDSPIRIVADADRADLNCSIEPHALARHRSERQYIDPVRSCADQTGRAG